MSVQDRFKRYSSTGGGVGLVRVEVLVPTEDREEILKLAADLRRQRREQASVKALKTTVNRESVNDRAKLVLHRLVARRLRARRTCSLPSMFDFAGSARVSGLLEMTDC